MEHAGLEVVAQLPQVASRLARELQRAAEHLLRARLAAAVELGEACVDHLRDGRELLNRAVVDELGDASPLLLLGEHALDEKRSLRVVGAQSIIASRSAMATACVRVSASSFARMCRTWLFTVSWLMKSFAATSAFDIPSASSWRISRSRGVRISACPCAETNSAMRPGSTNVSPTATFSIARRRVSCGASLRMYPRAPDSRPRWRSDRSPYAVKMSTPVVGARSRSCSVASRPSMSGMRRSMITTSGRRRSARATAEAPSAASPITRIFGERESARRRPSRTTSWSSAMRQVISSATPRFYGATRQAPPRDRSDREPELRELGRRLPLRRGHVAQGCAAGRLADRLLDRSGHARREVGPTGVELLVAAELLRPVAGERLEEVLARARPEMEQARPDASRAGGSGRAHDLAQLLGTIREA